MFQIIIIPSFAFSLIIPKHFQRILDAMFRSTWGISNSAIVNFGLLGQSSQQTALIARSLVRINQQCLSFKPFRCSIYILANSLFAAFVQQVSDMIKIFPGLNVIQPSNYHRKLRVQFKWQLLHSLFMSCNFNSRAAATHKRGYCISLRFSHIGLTKHELSIEIGKVDCVHIYQMNVFDSTQSKVFDDFTSQSASSDYEHRGNCSCFGIERCFFPVVFEGGMISQERGEVIEDTRFGGVYLSHARRGYNDCVRPRAILSVLSEMSLQQKLEQIFKESFQVRRAVKEVQNLREVKGKLGVDMRFSLTRHTHLTIFIELIPQKLRQIKKLSFLDKLEFKIVLKSDYPAEPPRLYILSENNMQIGIHPYRDYLPEAFPEWSAKVTCLDIVRAVPAFVIKSAENMGSLKGLARVGEYFEADRMFTFQGCQTFPVKLFRGNETFTGLLVMAAGFEVIVFEQTNFQGSYAITDFIPFSHIVAVNKHRTKLKCVLQIRNKSGKSALQFTCEQYETVVASLVDGIKSNPPEMQQPEEQSSQQDAPIQQSDDILVSDNNIKMVESEIIVLQSLSETSPTASNVKQLVELLKKAVEYYSVKSDPRCQNYLRALQTIMNNELLQVLLTSQDEQLAPSRKEYQSITLLV